MLLGGVAGNHAEDGFIPFHEGDIQVREVVIGRDECLGQDVLPAPAEHEAKEALGGLVEVSREVPAIDRCGHRRAESEGRPGGMHAADDTGA